ncbi:MAG TPA: BtrH N-terminal domain-containing protein [Anaerolineae bacterium]|nr:BtrH N-terminal domain-containing protein [Anaerolineae bacterium]
MPSTTERVALRGYRQFGARQSEAGALRNALAYAGVVAPHTGQAFTEEMLFGIGGGLGLGYFVYQMPGYASLFVATRITTEESARPGFILTMCERLGLDVDFQNASSAAVAEKKLQAHLAQGTPVIVWIDPSKLPYYGRWLYTYHALVVYGIDQGRDEVYVADRSAKALTLRRSELSAARQGEGAIRFRALPVSAPRPVTLPALRRGVMQGLRDFCDQMRNGFGPANFRSNFGLKALEKWAGLLTDTADKRGWPKYFPAGPHLFRALTAVFDQIENRGGGGSAFRPMYADFLEEASTVLTKPRLAMVAEQFRESARLWGRLAAALLPNSVALFKETKQLATRRRTLFEKKGMAAVGELQAIDARLAEIGSQVEQEFPLNPGEVLDLLAGLRDRVLAIHQVEAKAVSELQALLGRR